MAQRSQVPKFGNWENEEDVPYTAYFENARKGRGKKMNPNDPQDNPDYFSNNVPLFQENAEPKVQKGPEAVRSKHERRVNREDGELKRITASSLRHGGVRPGNSVFESETPKGSDALRPKHERWPSSEEGDLSKSTDSPKLNDAVGRRATVDSPHHRHGGISTTDRPRRVSQQSVGSDRSLEHSPLHPHHQARVGNKSNTVSSPLWERKVSSEGSHGLAPLTPGRSRLRSVTRGDETPDHSPAVPKFGDWDESDPASAEGYTHVFNKVREEKHNGPGKTPIITTEASYWNDQKRYGNDNSKGCGCFPWARK